MSERCRVCGGKPPEGRGWLVVERGARTPVGVLLTDRHYCGPECLRKGES